MTKGRGPPNQISEFKRVPEASRESNRCIRCGNAGHRDARNPRCTFNKHYIGPANLVKTGLRPSFLPGGNRNSSFRFLPTQNRNSIMAVQSHRINRQDTPSRGHTTFLSCIPPAPLPSLDSNYDEHEAPIGCFTPRKTTNKNSNLPRRKVFVDNSICKDCRMSGHKDMNSHKCDKFKTTLMSKPRNQKLF